MNNTYEFQIGQRVKQKDPDDGTMVYGTVTDKTRDTVFIQWDDFNNPCEHQRSEFPDIKILTNPPKP